MSDFLPPLIAEIRANAAQFYREVGKVGASVKKLERETESGLSPAQKNFRTLAGVGKAVALGLAGAAAVVGYESLKMATSFQSKITLLHTAAGESQANLKMVANGILNLAEATGTSVSQLADGAYIAEKAGYRGAEMLNVLKAASQGAKAEGVDLGTAMTALTSVMQSYGLKAKDAVSVENMLVRGSGLAKTTMQEYAGSLSTVVPLAAKLGVQFPELAGAIATMTQHGTSAQEATHELDNVLRSLSGANSVAVNAMGQLGLSSVKVAQTLGRGPNGLQNAIDMVVNAIQAHMGPSGLVVTTAFKQSSAASADLKAMLASMPPQLARLSQGFLNGSVTLTGYRKQTRGMGADGYAMGAQFMALAAKARGFNDMVKAGNPSAVTFVQYLKQMMGGATGLNTALMLTGNSAAYFKSATDQVAAAGAHAGANIDTWAATSKTLAVQLDQVKEGAQVLGIRIGTWLIPKVLDLIHIISSTVGWFEKHKGAALALAVVIAGALIPALTAYTVELAVTVAEQIAAYWPFYLIIAAAAALAYGIYELATHWKQAWSAIKTAAMAVWNYYLKPQFDAMKIAFQVVWTSCLAVYNSVIKPLFDFIGQHWKLIVGILTGGLSMLFTNWRAIWSGVEAVTSDVWSFLKRVFEDIVHAGLDWIMTQVHVFEAIWSGTWNGIRAAVEFVWNGLKAIFGFIVNYGIDPIRAAIGEFASFWRSIWYGIESVIQGVYNTIMSIVNGISNAISTVSNGISSIGSKANSVLHAGGDFNPLNWDVGGWVPGSPGQPIPGIVHGSEYVLSYEMLTGRQAIDPGVVQAVWGNLMRNKGMALSQLAGAAVSPNAPGTALPVTSAAGMANAGSAAGGSGGGMTVVVQGSIIDKDGFFRAVQEAALQHGGRNSQTWAPYARRR